MRRYFIWVIVPQVVLLAPLIATQHTDAVYWEPGDFVVAAALLATAGLGAAIASEKSNRTMLRIMFGLVIIAAAALIWMQLAVGIFE